MFTVKHVKANGEEFIIECASFFADRVEGTTARRFRTFDTTYLTDDYTGLWAGNSVGNNVIGHDVLYVMNRFGATVATHRFEILPPEKEMECLPKGILVFNDGESIQTVEMA